MNTTNTSKDYENWWEKPLDICPVCKKEYIPAPQHYWKIAASLYAKRDILVCSYSCMRKWEKQESIFGSIKSRKRYEGAKYKNG